MSVAKRVLISIAFIIVAGGIGYAVYRVFFSASPGGVPAAGGDVARTGKLTPARPGLPRATSTPPERIPTPSPTARGGLTLAASISAGRTTAPALSADGRSVSFYDPARGKFYRVGADGINTALSDRQFYNVQNVTWAPGQAKAIIEYPDGSKVLYDFDAQRQVTVPKHWTDFDFSPDGAALAGKSIGADPQNRWLFVANADGSGVTPLEPLGENADKVAVSWSPRKDIVAFSRTGTEIGFGREEIVPIGLRGENLKGLVVEGFGFNSIWSADGARLAYSTYAADDGYRPELWVVDGGARLGENRRRLNLATWADKCVAAGANSLYCAVPTELPEGAGFERSIAAATPDRIFRVDLGTGQSTLVAEPDARTSYGKLMLSADGKTLFLQDAGGGALRSIALP